MPFKGVPPFSGAVKGTTGDFSGDVTISGTLSSGIKEVIQSTTDTLTSQECRGTLINNYGQSAENIQTLPTCAEGLNFLFVVGTAGTGALHLKAGPGDKHYFDGTALDDGDKISLATPAVGDCLAVTAFKTGATSWDWKTHTVSGTATDGGA